MVFLIGGMRVETYLRTCRILWFGFGEIFSVVVFVDDADVGTN